MTLLLAILLAAQTVAAPALSGVVRDGSGQVVPRAVVIARINPGGEQRTTTGDDGRFSLPVTPGGEIVLIVRAPSFAESRRTIPAGAATAEVQVTLQPATLSETVTVTASRVEQRLRDVRIPVLPGESHIVPVMVGDPVHCKAIADALLERYGIYVQPINYPTVPRGSERLRLTPTPQHTPEQMEHLVRALTELWEACPVANGQYVRLAAE